jgi:hypothetical protein
VLTAPAVSTALRTRAMHVPLVIFSETKKKVVLSGEPRSGG